MAVNIVPCPHCDGDGFIEDVVKDGKKTYKICWSCLGTGLAVAINGKDEKGKKFPPTKGKHASDE